jgi:competence protein ComEA
LESGDKMNKRTTIIIIIGTIILIVLGLFFRPKAKEFDIGTGGSTDQLIQVKINGAILFPGVYEVENGTRLAEVIGLCGGLLKTASLDNLNLAQRMTENTTINIGFALNDGLNSISLNLSPSATCAFIYGAVQSPGIYELGEETTILDVIEAAGGLRTNADLTMINLFDQVEDEAMIYIPVVRSGESNDAGGKKINLNTAAINDLTTLSGIGNSKAQSIIDYRNKNGGFRSIEELLNIPGIGNETFNRLKDFVTI